MNNARKIAIIVIIIVLLILIGIIIQNVVKTTEKKAVKNMIQVTEERLEICEDNTECYMGAITYPRVTLEGKSTKLQKEIDKINEQIKKDKTQMMQNTDKTNCTLPENYKYTTLMQDFIDYYEEDEFLSLVFTQNKSDLCNGLNEEQVTILNYDKQEDKILTKKEMIAKYEINTKDMKEKIKQTLALDTEVDNKNIENIYIDREGNLYAYYKEGTSVSGFKIELGKSIKE